MNKRRIISLLIASSVILSLFAGCNNNEKEPADTTAEAAITTFAETSAETENTEADTEASADTTTEAEQGGESSEDNTVSKIADAIKAAYGDNYLPNMPMDNEMINTVFGFEEGSYTEAFAETPMISAQADTLVIVKAAEGKTDEVRSKLEAYRDRLVNDTMQYPMNIPKIEASQVVSNGDYVAFILLGGYNENEDASEEEQAKFAEEQNQIGIDAFNKYFG